MRGGLGTQAEIDPATTAEDAGRRNPHFDPPAVEQIASVFPQLEVLEFVGQGGMGAVYKARQTQLDRVVALKILPPAIGDDPAFAERFAREAKAMARLNHPGIVTIHDFGQASGLFYFVMEFIDGANLGDLLRNRHVSPREALQIVPQICDALQYAHDQGIVHRDIKPENILLDRQGRVKVADFGLAKLMGTAEEATGKPGVRSAPSPLTEAEKVMGTPQYMAPEQREHPLEVDHRADIYSLGVVLYQLLTGKLPEKPIEPPSRRVQVDVRLDQIVLRALEEDPERRYQSVSALKSRVETIAATPRLDQKRLQTDETRSVTDFDRVPWQIWIVVIFLAIEGVFGNLPMVLYEPMAATWFAAKCLFVTGLVRRWRWVFVMFLLEAVLHVFGFLIISPFVSVLNLVLVALALSAGKFYFPVLAPDRLRRENAVPGVVKPVLIGLTVFILWTLASFPMRSALRPLSEWLSSEAETPSTPPPHLTPRKVKRSLSLSRMPSAELTLANASMEEGDNAPNGWQQGAAIPGVEYLWDRAAGHNSQSSLCLVKTEDRYFPIAQWLQTVPREGEYPVLQVSTYVRAEEATKAVVDVIFLDNNGEWISHEWLSYIGAEGPNDQPVTHDWKEYSGQVAIPDGTRGIQLALQIYGPGKVWFDDVRAWFLDDATIEGKASAVASEPFALADVADIPSQDLTVAGKTQMRYFLIGPRENVVAPENGFKLLVVLPGGDGSADFNPFIRRIFKNALRDDYLVAQPVALKWRPSQQITWPTRVHPVEGQQFATEDFVEAVIGDVRSRHKLDDRHVFTLSWSSGGPAAYAISLADKTPVTGSYVAMSVFKPNDLPPLANAESRCYYIEHSPDDRLCPFRMAEDAERLLKENGAAVKFNTYDGGHGWRGDVYGRIRGGIQWLEGAVGK